MKMNGCCVCTIKIRIIKITLPYLSFALDCITKQSLCECFCVSALLNVCVLSGCC